MGLMDKVKAQATQLADKAQQAGQAGQAKLAEVQAKRKGDALLLELGGITYTQRWGGPTPAPSRGPLRSSALVQAYEAEHGPCHGDLGQRRGGRGDRRGRPRRHHPDPGASPARPRRPEPIPQAQYGSERRLRRDRWVGSSPPIPSSRRSSTGWTPSSVRRSSLSISCGAAGPSIPSTTRSRKVVDPLKQQVRDQKLWACHLGPELGGEGYGQVKLSLMNEILGRSRWAPIIFGCQAPDTGNAEIIAHYGTEEQKERYLRPLLDGEIFSSYSMTEPQGGSDPTRFATRARRDGDEWVLDGMEVLLVQRPDVVVPHRHGRDQSRGARAYQGMSMFLVPTDTPGVRDRAQHRAHGRALRRRPRGHARPDPLQRGPPAGREPARRGGPGLRHRPDPSGRRPHPPRHAHGGGVPEGARHDVRAGPVARDPGKPAGRQAERPELHRRLLRPAHAVPTVRAVRGVGDRPVPGLPQGPP